MVLPHGIEYAAQFTVIVPENLDKHNTIQYLSLSMKLCNI